MELVSPKCFTVRKATGNTDLHYGLLLLNIQRFWDIMPYRLVNSHSRLIGWHSLVSTVRQSWTAEAEDTAASLLDLEAEGVGNSLAVDAELRLNTLIFSNIYVITSNLTCVAFIWRI